MSSSPVTIDDVKAARALLEGVIRDTPVQGSRPLSERVGGAVWLKCENLQRAGSFKIRGAYTRISRLSPEERAQAPILFKAIQKAKETLKKTPGSVSATKLAEDLTQMIEAQPAALNRQPAPLEAGGDAAAEALAKPHGQAPERGAVELVGAAQFRHWISREAAAAEIGEQGLGHDDPPVVVDRNRRRANVRRALQYLVRLMVSHKLQHRVNLIVDVSYAYLDPRIRYS